MGTTGIMLTPIRGTFGSGFFVGRRTQHEGTIYVQYRRQLLRRELRDRLRDEDQGR